MLLSHSCGASECNECSDSQSGSRVVLRISSWNHATTSSSLLKRSREPLVTDVVAVDVVAVAMKARLFWLLTTTGVVQLVC